MKINAAAAKGKLPRYNHIVPKFILENFADNGKLSIFDKHTLRQFKLPTYRAMGEKDFNNVHIDGGVLSFEHKFTHIEDQAAPIIAQIVQQKSLALLSPMDQAVLHTFVVVQLLRSKRRRLDQAAIGAEIKKRWPEADLNPLKEKMANEEFEKFFALNATFSKLDQFASTLVSKHSYLMIKDCSGALYISDNPMVMHNSKQYGPYGNIGLAVPHIEIYYPLSHEIVLAYTCPLTMREMEENLKTSESRVNSHFGRMFMSPKGLSVADRLKIEQCRKEIREEKDRYALIKNERLVPMNSENLLFLNSLQVLNSFRYLACQKNDFHFATTALRERPHWKEGVGVKIC
jgi:Protein of unknown function (DUF4238)